MAVNAVVDNLDVEITHLNLKSLAMPLYDGDEEAANGLPEGAKTLKDKLLEHDGVVIGCPEYNGFMTPLLLNAIDWATRSVEGAPDLSAFQDKIILIASTSPGPLAGMRASAHLRTMLAGIGAVVIPDALTVRSAMQSFDDKGQLVNDSDKERAQKVADRLVTFIQALQS